MTDSSASPFEAQMSEMGLAPRHHGQKNANDWLLGVRMSDAFPPSFAASTLTLRSGVGGAPLHVTL